jgi:hypothetical protein
LRYFAFLPLRYIAKHSRFGLAREGSMKSTHCFTFAAALLLVGARQAPPVQASTPTPTRVFVAAQGSDSNPCSFALPCRTFQHAHDTVAAGGEIDVLDPAGYGAITITKSISIQGHGFSGISAPSGNAITIGAGANDKISLRGLLIDGVDTGDNGILFNAGSILEVGDCVIRNFVADGIGFFPSAASTLLVSNTNVAGNGGAGIRAAGTGNTSGVIEHVIAQANLSNGLAFGSTGTSKFTVSDSVISNTGNTGIGVASFFGNPDTVLLRNVAVSNSAQAGVLANGNAAVIWVTKSTITGNAQAFSTIGGGQILSFGDNSVIGNTIGSTPTNTISLE